VNLEPPEPGWGLDRGIHATKKCRYREPLQCIAAFSNVFVKGHENRFCDQSKAGCDIYMMIAGTSTLALMLLWGRMEPPLT
jgi:hypothetical protein